MQSSAQSGQYRSSESPRLRRITWPALAALTSVTMVCSAQSAAPIQSTQPVSSVATQVAENTLPDAPEPAAMRFLPGANQDSGQTPAAAADEPLTMRKMPLRFLTDEGHIFTSPLRVHAHDLVWLVPLAGATAAAFATDTHTMRDVVTHDPSFNNNSNTASDVLLGTAIAVPAGMFLMRLPDQESQARETGMLAGEAMVDAYAFDEVIKYSTLRERPTQDNARGHFYIGGSASDPSFISGHAIVTWSSAAVLAGEYNRPWQQAGIYTAATGVSVLRVLAQRHFPSDALLGSAAGWLIGHYVYKAHHRHPHHQA